MGMTYFVLMEALNQLLPHNNHLYFSCTMSPSHELLKLSMNKTCVKQFKLPSFFQEH
jgi:hypothetical protein